MITSVNNQQMKNLSNLLKKSKERKKQGAFVVEGRKMVEEAPRNFIQGIYMSQSYAKENSNAYMDVPCEIVEDSVFRAVSDTLTPQGIMAVVKMPTYQWDDIICGERTHLLLLESIQDPGNLGTMIRTAEGAGITGVIMNKTTVDLYNPKTIRSTMGSIYRVPYLIVDDLKATIAKLQESGVTIYAAHLKGEHTYDRQDYTSACGFLIGNEGNGLSDDIADVADQYVKIPMEGSVESLNAAISASLFMYECNRQRRRKNENLV